MRRNGDLAKDFALRHHVPFWTNNANELIEDDRINAIYIATPPDTHEYYTNLVAKSGKAVYVEKPMARNVKECQNMMEVCKSNLVPLFVAYYRRYLPLFLEVKNIIDSEMIGTVRFVDIAVHKTIEPEIVWASKEQINWRVNPEISGGGYFIDLASHHLDMLDYLLGPIINANGFCSNLGKKYEAEDQVLAAFEFENGVAGKGSWVFNLAENCNHEITTIYGSNGKVSFTFFDDFHILLEINGKEPRRMDYIMPEHVQKPLVESIIADLMGGEKCNSTGESAIRTSLVVDKIMGR
jgi:predicted dehydrogenase